MSTPHCRSGALRLSNRARPCQQRDAHLQAGNCAARLALACITCLGNRTGSKRQLNLTIEPLFQGNVHGMVSASQLQLAVACFAGACCRPAQQCNAAFLALCRPVGNCYISCIMLT